MASKVSVTPKAHLVPLSLTTYNIVIHTLDILESVYLNIFSCKDFDTNIAKEFSQEWFKGKVANSHLIERR